MEGLAENGTNIIPGIDEFLKNSTSSGAGGATPIPTLAEQISDYLSRTPEVSPRAVHVIVSVPPTTPQYSVDRSIGKERLQQAGFKRLEKRLFLMVWRVWLVELV